MFVVRRVGCAYGDAASFAEKASSSRDELAACRAAMRRRARERRACRETSWPPRVAPS